MRRGFTLIELLVSMVVIAVLMALLSPVLFSAVRKANEAAQISELSVMQASLVAFRDKYGAYPPSRIVLSETGDYSAAYFQKVLTPAKALEAVALTPRSIQYMRLFFPNIPISTSGTPLIVGGFYDYNGNGVIDPPVVLSGDECLVFFLGGMAVPTSSGFEITGFSMSVSNPFVPASKAPNRSRTYFQFDTGRLIDLNGNGYPSYIDKLTTTNTPMAYFASYGTQYDPDDCNMKGEASEGFRSSACATPSVGVAVTSSPGPNPYTWSLTWDISQNALWVKPDSYQIILAGRDGVYGIGGSYNPKGPDNFPFNASANSKITGVLLSDDARSFEYDNLSSFHGDLMGR